LTVAPAATVAGLSRLNDAVAAGAQLASDASVVERLGEEAVVACLAEIDDAVAADLEAARGGTSIAGDESAVIAFLSLLNESIAARRLGDDRIRSQEQREREQEKEGPSGAAG